MKYSLRLGVRVALIALAIGILTFEPLHNFAARAEPPQPLGNTFLERELPLSDGKVSRLKDHVGPRATVLVFLNTQCPISNGYIVTLNEFARRFAGQGVAVVGLNSNAGVSLKDMAAHKKEFGIQFPVFRDAGAVIADLTKVDHCPEVVLVSSGGTVQYRGRIDERYTRRGGSAGEIRRQDLILATEQFLKGENISVPVTEAIGCPITKSSRDEKTVTANPKQEVTYASHIAALLQKQCVSCHRTGGIGPFDLTSFDQAVSWADDIKRFTANRQMPPWMPTEGYGEFHNRRSMSEKEIELIAQWVDAGCPAGDLSLVPPTPVFQEGWTLGEPDQIIQPNSPYTVPADGRDIYQCFVIPTTSNVDQYVSRIEVRPGNARVVHHVLVFIDTTERSTQLDAAAPGEGYTMSAGFPGFLPAGSMGGWAPGNQPQSLADGMARVLPAKCKLVIQVHYHPSGKPEVDQTQIGLHFAKGPVTRTVRVFPVMPFGGPWSGMKLPAGEANCEVRTTMTVPRDSLVLNVTPHMHLLGKDMKLTATLPDGTVRPLIFIQRWDFNWQESYQYKTPVRLPKGTRLDLVAHYDNSAGNPSNPNSPPKEVTWGEQTSSEMCIAFLQLVPAEPAKSPRDLRGPLPGDLIKDALLSRSFFEPKQPKR